MKTNIEQLQSLPLFSLGRTVEPVLVLLSFYCISFSWGDFPSLPAYFAGVRTRSDVK